MPLITLTITPKHDLGAERLRCDLLQDGSLKDSVTIAATAAGASFPTVKFGEYTVAVQRVSEAGEPIGACVVTPSLMVGLAGPAAGEEISVEAAGDAFDVRAVVPPRRFSSQAERWMDNQRAQQAQTLTGAP